MKIYIRTLSFVLLTMTLISCKMKFNKTQWAEKDITYYYRERMVDDLLNTHAIIGLKYNDVIDIIGKPDRSEKLVLTYEIFEKYGSDIDPIHTKYLIITMSSDSVVTNIDFDEWEK